jgi:hypothetical protein
MSHEDDQNRECDVKERISSQIRAAENAHGTPITDEELQKLKAAASRLDQMLKEAADADVQILKSAAARLDQLLANIGTGRDVTSGLKRRGTGLDESNAGTLESAEGDAKSN